MSRSRTTTVFDVVMTFCTFSTLLSPASLSPASWRCALLVVDHRHSDRARP